MNATKAETYRDSYQLLQAMRNKDTMDGVSRILAAAGPTVKGETVNGQAYEDAHRLVQEMKKQEERNKSSKIGNFYRRFKEKAAYLLSRIFSRRHEKVVESWETEMSSLLSFRKETGEKYTAYVQWKLHLDPEGFLKITVPEQNVTAQVLDEGTLEYKYVSWRLPQLTEKRHAVGAFKFGGDGNWHMDHAIYED